MGEEEYLSQSAVAGKLQAAPTRDYLLSNKKGERVETDKNKKSGLLLGLSLL